MNEFKQAAERAADAVVEVVRHVLDEHPDAFTRTSETYWAMRDIARIESAKHYAEIRATYDKLVELAVCYRRREELDDDLDSLRNSKEYVGEDVFYANRQAYEENEFIITKLLADPLVVAELKREEK